MIDFDGLKKISIFAKSLIKIKLKIISITDQSTCS